MCSLDGAAHSWSSGGRDEPVFEAYIMGAQAPSQVLDIGGIAQGEDPPHERVVETVTRVSFAQDNIQRPSAAYTATWLQTVNRPRSRPCVFRRSSVPRRWLSPVTSTLLKP